MVILTAILQAKVGKETELEQALLELVKEVTKEEGCLEYRLHRSKNDTGQFYFYEKYIDESAFKAHGASPSFKATQDRIKELVVGETKLEFYELLDAILEK